MVDSMPLEWVTGDKHEHPPSATDGPCFLQQIRLYPRSNPGYTERRPQRFETWEDCERKLAKIRKSMDDKFWKLVVTVQTSPRTFARSRIRKYGAIRWEHEFVPPPIERQQDTSCKEEDNDA